MINHCCLATGDGVPTDDDLGEEPEDECAHLRMRDFQSSICFLCVSGVGWILCACGVGGGLDGRVGVGGWGRHGARRHHGLGVGALLVVDVPTRWGRKRLGGCGGAHVKYGGYSKKSGKANAPAILAVPSSCGSASGCVTKKSRLENIG